MSQGTCAACSRVIDSAAKLCPFCGANPASGERLDTQAILQEVFRPREMTTSDNVLEYARQRQGVVVTISVIVGFLVLAGLHAFVTQRNASDVTGAPAVPLSEIADMAKRADETTPRPMPELNFQYDGKPQTMRTYIVERGAATPPEVLAAQQAEALAKAQAQAAAQPAKPGVAGPTVATPGRPAVAVRPLTPPQTQQPTRPSTPPR
jgi:hypothetical protein